MNNKLDSVNSSKDLLYSEYTGTTVVEHVLEKLEQRTNSKNIEMFLQTKKKSEALERAKKLISLMDNNDAKNIENSAEDKNEINVVMEVSENGSNSNLDAWFFLSQSEDKVSECSEECEEVNSSFFRHKKILGVDSDTSDSEDDEQSFSSSYSNSLNFVFSDCSNFSESETKNSLPAEESDLCISSNGCDKNVSVCTKPKSPATKDNLPNSQRSKTTSMESPKKEQLPANGSNSLTPSHKEGTRLASPVNSRKRKLINIIEDDMPNA